MLWPRTDSHPHPKPGDPRLFSGPPWGSCILRSRAGGPRSWKTSSRWASAGWGPGPLGSGEAALGTGEGRLVLTMPGCPPRVPGAQGGLFCYGPHSPLQASPGCVHSNHSSSGDSAPGQGPAPWEAGLSPRAACGCGGRGPCSNRLTHPAPGSGGGPGHRGSLTPGPQPGLRVALTCAQGRSW